ncbi:hypothetical protein BV25DRAFT_32540 [Artomyces pyxidatus]|uniref:Uncharacterized protein n=1 Tax=Artomyces pyxidatus TaxID=48021 RepID=A0ACB8TK06_9AGAM|nr:hypothetical protein BV25DRAFT_32540 [Artomyces pyxidatus]
MDYYLLSRHPIRAPPNLALLPRPPIHHSPYRIFCILVLHLHPPVFRFRFPLSLWVRRYSEQKNILMTFTKRSCLWTGRQMYICTYTYTLHASWTLTYLSLTILTLRW